MTGSEALTRIEQAASCSLRGMPVQEYVGPRARGKLSDIMLRALHPDLPRKITDSVLHTPEAYPHWLTARKLEFSDEFRMSYQSKMGRAVHQPHTVLGVARTTLSGTIVFDRIPYLFSPKEPLLTATAYQYGTLPAAINYSCAPFALRNERMQPDVVIASGPVPPELYNNPSCTPAENMLRLIMDTICIQPE